MIHSHQIVHPICIPIKGRTNRGSGLDRPAADRTGSVIGRPKIQTPDKMQGRDSWC